MIPDNSDIEIDETNNVSDIENDTNVSNIGMFKFQ